MMMVPQAKLDSRVLIPDIASGGGFANFAAISYAQGGDLVNAKPALDLIMSIKGVKFRRQASRRSRNSRPATSMPQ